MKPVIEIEELFSSLCKEIQVIEREYIYDQLASTNPANVTLAYDDFKYSVKSYMILCHAAMEEFAELIALEVSLAARDLYSSKGIRIYEVLSGLQSNYGHVYKPNKGVTSFETSAVRYRKQIDELHSKFSTGVENSNGVGVKYLKFLFYSTNIDINTSLGMQSSLARLQEYRGDAAHKYLKPKGLILALDPDSAKQIVDDCLVIMKSAKMSAVKLLKKYLMDDSWDPNFNGSDIY
jgi:hypothetical protein